ncbi:MAG TPA: hypothetical protein VNL77_01895 [Roseiflexaceae bacterium]|nr:hypothetical protein [Roseiflexaceae bacterium]
MAADHAWPDPAGTPRRATLQAAQAAFVTDSPRVYPPGVVHSQIPT